MISEPKHDPSIATDLRRKRQREIVERMLERASCLPPPDLALLRAAYEDGRSAVELALLLGHDPRSLRRKLKRLSARVMSPEFLFVLRHRERWSPLRRKVATACILHGQSQRSAAQTLKLSLHTVRRNHLAVLAMYEAAST
jgi:DNA-directed RNA polymerase specialized sigma24 family protein